MAETIREFLVKIGYQVDGSSEQKFERSLGRATLRAELLGRAIAEAAEAVVRGATRIAAAFDDIYYASQRTKTSVENLKGLSYAVSQLGGSYEGTMQALESFSQKLRSNPGYDSLVRQLGVATKQNGQLRQTTDIVKDLAKALSTKPYYIQKQYFEALGLDERTFNALQSGDLVKYTEEYRKKQEALGVDQQKLSVIGKDLTQAWRSLSVTLGTLGDKLLNAVGPGLTDMIKRFDDFILRNADKIEAFFKRLLEILEEVVKAFMLLVEKGEGPIVEMFDKIVKSVDLLTTALTVFAAFLVGSWLVRVLGAFAAVGTGFGAMLLKLGLSPAGLAAAGLAFSASPANGGEDAEIQRRRSNGTWGNTPTQNGTTGGGGAAPPQITDKRNWWQRTMPKVLGGRDAPSAGSGGGNSNAPIRGSTFTQKAPGIMKRLQEDFGLTKEQAAGVMGNLGHESGGLNTLQERNPIVPGSRGGYGWAQWTGPRRKAFEKWAADNGHTDLSSDEANYGFLKHELRTTHRGAISALKKTGTAEEASVSFEQTYEGAHKDHKAYGSRAKWANRALRAAERAAASGDQGGSVPYSPFSKINAGSMSAVQSNAALFGAGIQSNSAPLTPAPSSSTSNVDMQQKTEITIIGGGDPAATGAAVADAQKGVNGSMLRNMQGAVR